MRRDYLRLGLLIGAAVVMVGHFATQTGRSDNELFLFWLVLGLGIALLIAFALERSSRGAQRGSTEEGARLTTTGELKSLLPTTTRFYAVSRVPSSAEMRALMVDAPAIPGNPISSRLQLIIERYDAYSRVVLDASLLDYPAMEIALRVRDEALARLPATTAAEVRLDLFGAHSAGPLDASGRSPHGWTFEFIDGAVGVQCTATVTETRILLVYRTAVSYPRPTGEPRWIDPAEALALARAARPELADVPLWLRVDLPAEYYLLRLEPLRIYEIGPRRRQLIGPDLLPPLVEDDRPPKGPTVSELATLLTNDEPSELKEHLLATHKETVAREASRLFRQEGPTVVEELSRAAIRLAETQPAATRALVHLISLVPSDLAVLALMELSEALPKELEGIAFSLFEKRRHDELDVSADPLFGMDFEDSRALLGKGGTQRIALRSTYNPESELLPSLEEIGLEKVRVRLLSGDTELFLSANLTSKDRRTEALLSSSPLPVPCHILRILGPEAEVFARRVKEIGIHYPEERIIEDILMGRPYDLHRGALYLAALQIDAPLTFKSLTLAATGNRTNLELRRAALAALAHLNHPEVDDFLAKLDEPDLAELAEDLRRRRAARAGSKPAVTEEGPEAAVGVEPEQAGAAPPKEVSAGSTAPD